MADLKVAIVGSGLTGLVVAQGLRKNDIKATVYERDPSLTSHSRDWTLMLHWGLHNVNEILPTDILEAFPEAFCDPFYTKEQPPPLPMLNGVTGDVLFHIPSMPMRLISRQRFRQILSRNLDVQYNRKLINIVENEKNSVTLTFDNGKWEKFDIVIGADGANSFVRRHLLDEERAAPIHTPWAISLSTFQFNDSNMARFARRPHDVWQMAYAPEGIGAIAVIDSGPTNDPSKWKFSYLRLWHQNFDCFISRKEALRTFKRKCENFCEPYRSAAAAIPDNSDCNIDQLKYWAPVPWENTVRRVTLAGDAAHALLPFRGQGLNVCLDDASKLINFLVRIRNGEDRKLLIGAYDRDVVARGRAAVLASLEEGLNKMDFDKVMASKTATQGFAKEPAKIEEAKMERSRFEGPRMEGARI